MGSLPPKAVTGANFKKWTVETLNKLIDYLHGARIRPGYGISVRETPSGTIVELAKKQAPVINNTTGGGTTQDISATVSGGTATVALSGSTSSVDIVGGSNVSITGNTNGQIEISATGGTSSGVGFPAYTSPLVEQGDVLSQTNYPGTAYADQSVWLIGNLSVEPDANGQLALSVRVLISHNGNSEAVYLSDFLTQTNSYIDKLEIPVSMPIPAGHTFQIIVSQTTSADPTSGLAIYPCI